MAKKKIDPGFVQAPAVDPSTPDYVIAELRHDSRIRYSSRGFAAPSAVEKEARSLNDLLEGFKIQKVRSHFGMKAPTIHMRATEAPPSLGIPVSAEFAHSGFVQIIPESAKDAEELAISLNRRKSVWNAYVAPRPVPAAIASGQSVGSRNFEPSQGYLHSPPDGIGAMTVWSFEGGRGEGVTICDIEGNWNRNHEDLPEGIQILGGTQIRDLGWRNHGTAVLGEMVSIPNDVGTAGICHKAKAVVQSAVINGVWNTAGAIRNASQNLKPGDVILIELQATGPRGRYVAMQFWDDVFSAILDATERGITVVEAAGNGNENFDLAIFRDTGLQKDAGAIVVGAGIPPTNFHDHNEPNLRYNNIGVPRSRIWFSNYGKIVNVQAWGWHVTTLGYGDAQGGRGQNRWYTLRFRGTSSASPIVTGAVTCIQGRAKAVRGRPLPPDKVRSLLIQTGTPQERGPRVPLRQHIGPQPNLQRAFRLIR